MTGKNLVDVICINAEKDNVYGLKLGFPYKVDMAETWGDSEGLWLTTVYDEDGKFLANNVLLSRFTSKPLKSWGETRACSPCPTAARPCQS